MEMSRPRAEVSQPGESPALSEDFVGMENKPVGSAKAPRCLMFVVTAEPVLGIERKLNLLRGWTLVT